MENVSENNTLAMGLWPRLKKGKMNKNHFLDANPGM
jgi:hypothetical protein